MPDDVVSRACRCRVSVGSVGLRVGGQKRMSRRLHTVSSPAKATQHTVRAARGSETIPRLRPSYTITTMIVCRTRLLLARRNVDSYLQVNSAARYSCRWRESSY